MLAIAVLGLLAGLVLSRKGNLAWDDADYLRRGLSNARFAESAGPLFALHRAIDRLLMEQPKPPWFVAWIELGVHAIGRRNIDLLILFATVVPYALLMTAVTAFGRWLRGPWGGFLSLLCLAASPLSLAFGGKVMVETFLALWVLLVYGLAALYLTAPSRKIAAALGFAVALALLTKLTTVLFLPGPLIYGFAHITRSGVSRAIVFKRLTLCALVCLAVAGPWYWKNVRPAVKFAFFSSKYNEVATGRERISTVRRAAEIARDLAGWPLIGTIATGTLAVASSGATTETHDRPQTSQRPANPRAELFRQDGVARRGHRGRRASLPGLLRHAIPVTHLAGACGGHRLERSFIRVPTARNSEIRASAGFRRKSRACLFGRRPRALVHDLLGDNRVHRRPGQAIRRVESHEPG